ncbi:apoptosis regulator BAX-like isoform X2 [Sardina pilchardus]
MQEELKEVPAGEMPSLPEPEPLDGKGDEILANEIGDMMIIVGDSLVKKYGKELNDKLDGFRKGFINNPKKKDFFQTLVEKVFADGDVNWGRIAMLFYTVAKIAGEVSDITGAVADIFSWTLSYFKKNLLDWILKMGGWICSIAAIAFYRVESVSCPPKPKTDHAIAISCFVSGIILGGFLVFWLKVKGQ